MRLMSLLLWSIFLWKKRWTLFHCQRRALQNKRYQLLWPKLDGGSNWLPLPTTRLMHILHKKGMFISRSDDVNWPPILYGLAPLESFCEVYLSRKRMRICHKPAKLKVLIKFSLYYAPHLWNIENFDCTKLDFIFNRFFKRMANFDDTSNIFYLTLN